MKYSRFNKIAVQEDCCFTNSFITKLTGLSHNQVVSIQEGSAGVDLSDAEVDVLISSWNLKIDEAFLQRFPNLKFIFLRCTTLHMIDLDVTKKQGILISNIDNYSNVSTAEFIVYLILLSNRSNINRVGNEVKGKVLGLIGYGKVAKIVDTISTSFGIKVAYTNKSGSLKNTNSLYLTIEQILSISDFISFNTPAFTEVISEEQLYLIRNGTKIFITTLGLPVKCSSLIKYLGDHPKTEVYLDKLALCIKDEFDLVNLPNVYFFDIYSARTQESIEAAERAIMFNILKVLKENVV